MRFVRFDTDWGTCWGRLEESQIHVLSQGPYLGGVETGEVLSASGIRLLAPCEPSKVLGVGLNYADHRGDRQGSDSLVAGIVDRALGHDRESHREPILFLKAPSAVVGPGAAIVLPSNAQRVDYEAELAVVIGHRLHRPTRQQVLEGIFGYTCANDVSARDLQERDGQWMRAKSFDTFCPVGPWVETELDPSDLALDGLLNGEVRQHARTSHMLVGTLELVRFAAQVMTLLPGDILLTGTPTGVGVLRPGDHFTVRIEGIGELQNPVEADCHSGAV